jgi:hypothetical protein
MSVDSNMIGKKVRIYLTRYTSASNTKQLYISFLNSSNSVISTITVTVYTSWSTYDNTVTIPSGTTSITIGTDSSTTTIRTYEIQPVS